MKYDDASWYLERNPSEEDDDVLQKNAGTHTALLLKWCCLKGWANPDRFPAGHEGLQQLIRGGMSARDFLFDCCDGQFDSEALTTEGNAFLAEYFGPDGDFMFDYCGTFPDQLLIGTEADHDFSKFSEMVERRYQAFLAAPAEKAKRPWWKFW
jgi:hypothetical protein